MVDDASRTDVRAEGIDGRNGVSPRRWPARLLRYGLPVIVAVGGLLVMLHGSESDLEGGAGIVSAGLAIWAVNWLIRASIDGDGVRDEEQYAREYFSRHGHWPGESPGE